MSNVNEALFGSANRFSAFLASTNQKVNIGRHMNAIFNDLAGLTSGAKPLFIDVGCGEGELTVPVYQTLLRNNPNVRLVGVDPSRTMTDALSVRLGNQGLQGHVVTDKLFDHPSGDVPMSVRSVGAGDIVLCSHAIYYAEDVDVATDQILSVTGERGIIVSVHQSKESQMHILRNEFSTVSVRYPRDNQPITADHMEERLADTLSLDGVAHCNYTSDLYCEPDTVEFINDFIALLESGVGQGGFSALVEKYGQTAVIGRNVLEFILREDLFDAEAERAVAFLEGVVQTLDANSLTESGKPKIIISESISFVSPSQEMQSKLEDFAGTYQAQILAHD